MTYLELIAAMGTVPMDMAICILTVVTQEKN